MLASQAGHVDLVEKLIEAGANMNIQSNSADTALIFATKENKINCVKKLTELGANVNIRGGDGQTALNHAAINEDGNCLEALLEGGANPDITNHKGFTTLSWAIWMNSLVSVDKFKSGPVLMSTTLTGVTLHPLVLLYTAEGLMH